MPAVNFKKEIAAIDRQLESERSDLADLEQRYSALDGEFGELREAVEHLRAAVEGRDVKAPKSASRVDLNPETGRPSRGARRDQLAQICKRLGRGQKTFRTVDVLHRVREIEGDVTPGIRSYTYSIMKTFVEDGLLEKVGRGTWKLS